MSAETHNAVLRFQTTPGAGAWPAYKKEFEARKWLSDNGYPAPLIVYRNVTPSGTTGNIVVVLTDRDTALMLKLALS